MRSLGASEVRNNLAEVLEQVHYGQERVAIERWGKPFAALVSIEDLELLRSGEIESLRQSEARLRSILEHAPAEIYLKDTEGRYLQVNRRYEELWGISDQEARGKLPADILDDEGFAEAIRSHDLAVLESGQATEREDCVNIGGDPRTLRMIKFPIRDDSGEVTGLGAIAIDVTEHKKAEESVRKTQSLFEETERLARLGHWEWDEIEDRCTYCSEELARLHGVTVEDYLARATSMEADLEWAHPEDRERIERIAKRARNEGAGFEIEYRLLRGDGEVLEVREVASPFLDENGALVRTVGFVQDITERKRAEDALRLTQICLDHAGDAVFWIGPDGGLRYMNERGCAMLGYTAEEIDGLRIMDIDPEVSNEAWSRAWKRIKEKSPYTFEARHRRKDGSEFTVEVSILHVRYGGKELACSFSRDITERKQAEEALLENEALLEQAAVMANLGHWVWDEIEDRCVHCSETLARLSGATVEDYLARSGKLEDLLSRTHPDDRSRYEEIVAEAKRAAQPYDVEYRARMWSGEYRYLRERGEPVLDEAGRLVRSVGTLQDITDYKRTEEALKQARDELEQRVEERTAELSRANESLRASEARFAGILDISAEAVISIDSSQRIELFNQGAEKIFGYSAEEMVGQQLEKLIPGRSHKAHRKHIEAFAQSDDGSRLMSLRRDVMGLRKDGSEFPAEASISKLQIGGETIFTVMLHDITERRQAGQALRESEERFRQMAENIEQVLYLIGPDLSGILYVSPAYETVWGRTCESLHEDPASFLMTVDPEDRERVSKAQAKQPEGSYDETYRILRPDGSRRWIRDRAFPVRDEDGKVVRIVGIAEDITERTQAEEAAEHSRELLASAVEALDEGFVIFDAEGRLVLSNSKFRSIYWPASDAWEPGTPLEQVARDTAAVFIGLKTEENIEAWVQGYLEQHRQHGLQFDQPFVDGRWIQVAEYPLPNGWTVGTRTDISEMKRAEQELRGSEAQLKQAQTMAKVGTFVWDDVTNSCAFCSEELADLLNMSVEEFMDKRGRHDVLLSLIHEDDRDRYQQVIDIANETLHPYDVEYKVYDNDGNLRYWREMGRPQLDSRGRLAHTFGTVQDITETKHAEEQLRQAQKMEAVGQLTGGVAHDFNNLLAVIVGNAEFLEDQLGKDDKVVQGIMQAATRGAELTERLLAFSRRQPLDPQPTDLGALIEKMTGLMQRTLGETIEIETVRAAGLRDALADSGQLENAILNLALNARDAMPGGGKLLIEALNATLDEDAASQMEIPSGDYVVVAVSDTGTGMSPEVQEHVFEPFFTTKDVGEGSGLGLSMVYGFAKQSGGSVTIYSEPEHGTTVKIYLPCAREKAEPARDRTASDVPRGRGEVLLVVEDDPEVRALAERMLEDIGYRVVSAGEASAGLEVLEETPDIELLLSDVVLPGGMNGLDFAREARTRRPALKVLFMSGYTGSAIFQSNLHAEGVEALQKPFRKLDLAQKIREALDE